MTKNSIRDSLNTLYDASPFLRDELFFDKKKWSEKLKDKKFQESIRREFFYTNLNLLASQITIFDVMSIDTFEILINAKKIAKCLNYEEVTNEILLLSFLLGDKQKQITRILQKEKRLNKNLIYEKFLEKNQINLPPQAPSFFDRFINFFKKYILVENVSYIDTKFNFSKETLDLLLKTTNQTFSRFKTIVITPEILFINLMENKNDFAAQLIIDSLPSQIDWYDLRHFLIKKTYLEEKYLRCHLDSKHFFYIYLLKTRVPQDFYNHFISKDERAILYSGFRKLLFPKVLTWDRNKFIKDQTIRSMRINSLLNYSPRAEEVREILTRRRKKVQEKFEND